MAQTLDCNSGREYSDLPARQLLKQAASLTLNGGGLKTDGDLTLSGGAALQGVGTIDGGVNNVSGIVNPGLSSGGGTLNVRLVLAGGRWDPEHQRNRSSRRRHRGSERPRACISRRRPQIRPPCHLYPGGGRRPRAFLQYLSLGPIGPTSFDSIDYGPTWTSGLVSGLGFAAEDSGTGSYNVKVVQKAKVKGVGFNDANGDNVRGVGDTAVIGQTVSSIARRMPSSQPR